MRITLKYSIAGVISLLILMSACSPKATREDGNQPNIIFIMSDDHAFQAINAYGGPLAQMAQTPNIELIAEGGMRFDRGMVTNSICGP